MLAIVIIYLVRKLREYYWGWVRTTYSLEDKIFIITGANAGIGFEAARDLVKRNATIIMACRSEARANEAINEIRKTTTAGKMVFLELDLSSFDSIHKFAAQIKKQYPVFDCLVNNAGVGIPVRFRPVTKENFEIHCGVNHLGHFLLTHLLSKHIKKNKSRIVVVTSQLHQQASIDFEQLGKYVESRFGDPINKLYNNSKLMNFYHARELYKRGFDVHILCPGLCHTDFFRDYNMTWYKYVFFSPVFWLYLKSSHQGAQNLVHAATDDVTTDVKNAATGYFIVDMKTTKSTFTFSDEVSEKLWNESEKLCGIVK
jgi:NAD(P)-dependent dehydrogenase (short-subunit alcohol dehydrogenase family)